MVRMSTKRDIGMRICNCDVYAKGALIGEIEVNKNEKEVYYRFVPKKDTAKLQSFLIDKIKLNPVDMLTESRICKKINCVITGFSEFADDASVITRKKFSFLKNSRWDENSLTISILANHFVTGEVLQPIIPSFKWTAFIK